MSELIDRDLEISSWEKAKEIAPDERYLVDDIIESLRTAPTVEERQHGHWIKTDWGEYQCSVCKNCEETMSEEFNEDLYFNEADFMERNKFCRQCGARMDEKCEE